MPRATQSLPEVTSDAIRILGERGYDATSVDDLAEAVGISRSTFFRRFGSKEDIVFADHDYLLERLDAHLAAASGDPLWALETGARTVLDYHVGRREVALLRNNLLHANSALRDRELVASHHYERRFVAFLRAAIPQPTEGEWALTALAAGVVAVHNQVLRAWLRDESVADGAELSANLRGLTDTFRPVVTGSTDGTAVAPARVVVAVFDGNGHPDDVVARIRESLDSTHTQ